MTGSKRFLLLLLLACLTCVVLIQVTLDGWNLQMSFSYGIDLQSKDVQRVNVKAIKLPSESNLTILPTSTTTVKKKIISTKLPIKTSSTAKDIQYNNISQSHQIKGVGQVRRLPLGKGLTKLTKERILISKQDRIKEILEQRNVIHGRRRIDPLNSLKPIPLVNPNNVTRIIILTYFRAGSSFFGDLLQQNWKTFYHFEPLHSMTYSKRIHDNKTKEAFDLFNGVFKCNFKTLPDYIHWVQQPQNQFLFSHNLFLRVTCRNNPKICFNSTFVSEVCRRAPVHVMKLTRLSMRHLKAYLEQNPDMKFKIVYLIRDPRGIVSSRWTLDWCNGTTECSDPNVLCQEMYEDLKIFNSLQKENPSNFIKIRYEDISLNPGDESRKLFKFLQLPFSTSVQRFLKTHTVGRKTDDKNPYSTRRNTTAMAYTWRERFTFKQVEDVQSLCKTVLNSLNYSPITSPEQLPYPNGKLKSNDSLDEPSTFYKNPLLLKIQQNMNKSILEISNKLQTLPMNSTVIKLLNNTNIEIHKTYNITNHSSFKNNLSTLDYILVKQTV